MKYFSKISIYAGITALSLTCFVGCKNNNNTTTQPTNEVTVAPDHTQDPSATELEPVATQDDTIVTDNVETNAQTDNSTNNNSDEDTNNNNKNNTSSYDGIRIFTDHLNTAEYKVTTDGTYKFQCEPSDKKAYWDVYVLDEPFEDAFRYLSSAYTPALKATNESNTIKLKKGQYVYCICSENSFTDEGTSDNFKCPLTINLED